MVLLHQELQAYEQAFRASRAKGQHISEWQVSEYEAMLSNSSSDARLLVAEVDGALVGFIFFLAECEMLEHDAGQVYIQDIMVTSSMRRTGVGSALMDGVRSFMAERGIHRMDLQVLVENVGALAFYRQQGFTRSYLGLRAVEEVVAHETNPRAGTAQ